MVIQEAEDSCYVNIQSWIYVTRCRLSRGSLVGKLANENDPDVVKGPTRIYVDDKPTISLVKNSVHRQGTKHINVKFHFICGCIENKDIEVEYANPNDMIKDNLTDDISE